MKNFSKYLLRGILTLLPLLLTLYPLYYFFTWSDSLSRSLSEKLLPGIDYIPGSGIVLGILALVLLGVLMSSQLMQRLYGLIELPFKNIPLVKSLYNAIKELTVFLSPSEDQKADKVVLIRMPGNDTECVGFVMRDNLKKMPEGVSKEDRSAVYIPMSYQVGGFTLFLPNDWLTPLDISVDEAMKNTLTGWIARTEK
ncbi:MAG: DUF502 domain-containing protein [Gammaproteobacteria bacterium]